MSSLVSQDHLTSTNSLCHVTTPSLASCQGPKNQFSDQEKDCISFLVELSKPLDQPLTCDSGRISETEETSDTEEEVLSPTSDSCLFCGTVLQSSDMRKRCKTPASIREFVKEYCRPTAFIYPVFAEIRGDRRVPLCIACVNWQRRCSKGQRKRCNGKKPMLLMDHFVAFMLEPGKTIVPDQRCTLRLVKALLAGLDGEGSGEPLGLSLMPVQVQAMVARLPRDITSETLLPQLVKAWWEFNGKTVFFAHNLTAKLVRKMIKVF